MTFQPPSKSFTARDYQFIALVTVLFLIISTALVLANFTLKGGGDFYVHWVASRGFVYDHVDPYGGEVPARVQQLVYGSPVKAGDKPYILVTPFHILLLYFPASLLSDPHLARAIYTLILELALFALAILSLQLTEWEAPRLFSIIFIVFAVFNFYSFQAIYEATPVLLLGFLFAEILLALRFEMDELAGVLIAVSFYYWEVSAPFLILIGLRVYYEKRNRVFAGFIMSGLVLLILSFLAYPGWIIPFLRAVSNNIRIEFGFSIHTIFTSIWPAQGRILAWIFIAALVIILGFEWSAARSGDYRRFYWAACLSVAMAPLLGFRTEMSYLSVLIIPLALVFSTAYQRWRKMGSGLTTLLMLLIFAVPWLINLFAVKRFGAVAGDTLFLFIPICTIIGLYWIRWWAIHPPRIWSDLATRP